MENNSRIARTQLAKTSGWANVQVRRTAEFRHTVRSSSQVCPRSSLSPQRIGTHESHTQVYPGGRERRADTQTEVIATRASCSLEVQLNPVFKLPHKSRQRNNCSPRSAERAGGWRRGVATQHYLAHASSQPLENTSLMKCNVTAQLFSATLNVSLILMDPGGNDLEPDLSQIENPCLIVEDSQPDSAALEEDPESSYRALLARRLSSLQPTSHSPVLELISSPSGSRCSQTDSQTTAAQSNKRASPVPLDSPCVAQEDSQVFGVCPPAIAKRDLPHSNGKCSGEGIEMDTGADSTTPCVQSEGGTSQFAFLELSESQGFGGELNSSQEDQKEECTAPGQMDNTSQGCAKQVTEENSAEGLRPDSQNSTTPRSEVSSSCPPEPTCLEGKERSIQNLLHAHASEAHEAKEVGNNSEVPSSQDDLFEGQRNDIGGVDSTVPEAEDLQLPTSTPANSLHLLHLSGQGTLVQESLSQNSVEFVAPTQERLSQTPLIVPSSPTVQANEAVEEPMDTSIPPDEPDHPSHREEEPMEMDHTLSQTDHKLPPAASTPVSHNSPSFVLGKTLSVPSQPDFSHDVFVPTQSQERRGSNTGSEPPVKKETSVTPDTDSTARHEASVSEQSHPSMKAESFQLELSTISENTGVAQQACELKQQEEEEQDDSQATQIEEIREVPGTAARELVLEPCSQQEETDDSKAELKNSADLPKTSQVPDLISSSSKCNSVELNARNDAKADLHSGLIRPDAPSMNIITATETTDLTDTRGSQKQNVSCTLNVTKSQEKLEVADLKVQALKCAPQETLQEVHASLASRSESQATIPKENPGDGNTEDVLMEAQSKSPDVCVVTGSKAEVSQMALQGQENEDMVDEEKMDEGEKPEISETEQSKLCLSLSQRHMVSPEPMEEDVSPLPQELSVPKESIASAQEKVGAAEEVEEQEKSNSVIVVEEGERTSQPDKATHTCSPELSVPMQSVPMVPTDDMQHPSSQVEVPVEKSVSSRTGTEPHPEVSNPAADCRHWLSEKATSLSPKTADREMEQNSENRSPSNSSGEIPFHFTLPKEGELIRPVANVTPPLLSQLKKTPRHSTPIGMSSLSERSVGDVAEETAMAASEIMVEESGEETKTENEKATEHDGKLSFRMKLVTPVEESSSVSEHFSLQKPALLDEEGSVSRVTTVVKAVTSSTTVPSVFSRVCEVRRQEEAQEKVQPSNPSTPTRGDLFNSASSQVSDCEKAAPGPLTQRLRNLPRSNAVFETSQSEELSPSSTQEGSMPASPVGSSGPERISPQMGRREEPPAETVGVSHPDSPAGPPGPKEGVTPAPCTPPRQRTVSQQTSFDTHISPSHPSKLHQKAVSQQTSFEANESHFPSVQGDLETPPLRPLRGQAVRRHVRTIREVRTTVTRIITDIYYENGQEVDRKVTEESEEPVVDCRVMENDISPSRTGSSMTSGDLADVSSLSSKTSSLQHSSSGTSSIGGGPAKQTDFIVPNSRGAKSASPRKASGQQQRAHCGPGGSEWMEDRGRAPLTPRGRGRRGRPPSRSPFFRGAGNLARDSGRGPASYSSEEDSYRRVCPRVVESPANAPDSPEVASDTSRGTNSFVGLRVVAKWSSNGYFYSGCITCDSGAGRFRLLFDDRYECDVPGKDILLCDPIPLETEVTALSEDEYFSTGVVKGYKTEGSDFFYCVEKDGQQKWYSRMAVILSMEQGNRLREQYSLGPYEPTTPLTKASDISLDNLVEGKRKRRGNAGGAGTPTRSSSDSPRTPGPSGKRKYLASAEEERTPAKRGRKSAGPRTGQRLNVCNTSGSGTDLPSDPGDLVETHGPLPQSASLFLGYAFLLTASSEHDRKTNQQTSDGEEEFVTTAPYNKRYTVNQLEAGGGYVLQDFNEEQCNAAYQSILIADQHCRTEKYLLCLAGGIPCVSHMWVRDCCHDNQLLNYRNYLLPAGVGPDDKIVEWHPRHSPFQSMKVLLAFQQPADLLIKLIRMGGATSVHQHKADTEVSETTEGMFDLVVTDQSCPPPVLNWAISLDLPLVSPEWLIQSLICGKKLGYRSHAHYQYDYSP
ncbi:tumor suppressor p53-binding protein 1 isoform X4 [Arapaima gigas]